MIDLGFLMPLFTQRLITLGYPVVVGTADALADWPVVHFQLDVEGTPSTLSIYLVGGASKDEIRDNTEVITKAALARRDTGVATTTHVQFLEALNLYMHLWAPGAPATFEPVLATLMRQFVDHRTLGQALAKAQAFAAGSEKAP
ncbi:MAG: hypothetical protein IPL61_28630 [Myxococcales bacterium]|nr:hypothetical protein [Myxococcales bacterium]